MRKQNDKVFSESVNFADLRKFAGMTLDQAARLSGYGVATINGLEKTGAGSRRLRERLLAVYQTSQTAEYLSLIQETPTTADAVMYEKSLASMQHDLKTEHERAERAIKGLKRVRVQLESILRGIDKSKI